MSLKIDYSLMFRTIEEEVIKSYGSFVKKAHKRFLEKRESGELPFYNLPYEDVGEILDFADSKRGNFKNLVVLGIGGSALGLISLNSAVRTPYQRDEESPYLYVLDNIDPERVHYFLTKLDPSETLINVITKSGSTAETMASFLVFKEWLEKTLGSKEAKERIIVTTDAKRGTLRKIADSEGYKSFVVPDGVGGRFSVLTPVGLVPAALLGINVKALLRGAALMDERLKSEEVLENPAYLMAAFHHAGYLEGRKISVMFAYSDRLLGLADWYRQLWAESLGKKFDLDGVKVSVGPTPVKALGVTDQHSQVQLYKEGPDDKIYTFLRVEKFRSEVEIPSMYENEDALGYLGGHTINELFAAEELATEVALAKEGRPVTSITFPVVDESHIGEFFYLMEVATLMAGEMFYINPLDQPGVEAGKQFTYGLLGRKGYEDKRSEILEFRKE